MKACWAPITSLLSRLISAPVWVRVKKAMGIRWMWPNTWDRMSKISPSPTLADTQRMPMVSPVSAKATPAGHQGQADDQGLVVVDDPVVDDRAEQQRVDDPDDGVDDHQHQEPGQDLPVGRGEAEHPPGGALGHVLLGDRIVAPHGAHDPAELATAATHAHPCPAMLIGWTASDLVSCDGPYCSAGCSVASPGGAGVRGRSPAERGPDVQRTRPRPKIGGRSRAVSRPGRRRRRRPGWR